MVLPFTIVELIFNYVNVNSTLELNLSFDEYFIFLNEVMCMEMVHKSEVLYGLKI